MFSQIIKNIIRNVIREKSRTSQKILNRGILTSQLSFSGSQAPDIENDIIVKSLLPSVDYPDCMIHQYVWNNLDKWSGKTALVDIQSKYINIRQSHHKLLILSE